jgi:hypothetical protein
MSDQACDWGDHSNPIWAAPPGNIQSLQKTLIFNIQSKWKNCNYEPMTFQLIIYLLQVISPCTVYSFINSRNMIHISFISMCNEFRPFKILIQIPSLGHYKFKSFFFLWNGNFLVSIVMGWLKPKNFRILRSQILQSYPLPCNTMLKFIFAVTNVCIKTGGGGLSLVWFTRNW